MRRVSGDRDTDMDRVRERKVVARTETSEFYPRANFIFSVKFEMIIRMILFLESDEYF